MVDRHCSLSDSELDMIDGADLGTLPRHSHFFTPNRVKHSKSTPLLLIDGRLDLFEPRKTDRDPVFSFDNRLGLAHDLGFLASMPELCDITFLVGEDRQPVCGVKAILGARSRSVEIIYVCMYILYMYVCVYICIISVSMYE